ncbi:MAG: hypothetical protein HY741_25740 [Chloroflexi bacterium]|nr:hypothetical protein [Chloroflexota bacterium]
MRVNDFLDLVAHETHKQLPARWRTFRTWKRYTLIQFFYSRRAIHYEVWVRGGNIHALEIGLHCEADAATNRAILEKLDVCLFEIKDALGDRIEAEQWTKSWTRVHELMPYEKLDDATARACARRLAKMIAVLEPILRTERSPQRSPDARTERSPQRSPDPRTERSPQRSPDPPHATPAPRVPTTRV